MLSESSEARDAIQFSDSKDSAMAGW